jgi:hypothetical protein
MGSNPKLFDYYPRVTNYKIDGFWNEALNLRSLGIVKKKNMGWYIESLLKKEYSQLQKRRLHLIMNNIKRDIGIRVNQMYSGDTRF